ncbi:MAG TPA: bacterial transcriptional activator domain-containing protein, partial [Aggregatilineales bacterium]|nr:bacterial transcriptional activator domain-containing protein [Aggregatilineales bacterium]
DENRPEPALTLLLQATKENPLRQDIHRRVMTLYSDLGRRSEAASHFKKMKSSLDNADLGLEKETEQLYSKLMS